MVQTPEKHYTINKQLKQKKQKQTILAVSVLMAIQKVE